MGSQLFLGLLTACLLWSDGVKGDSTTTPATTESSTYPYIEKELEAIKAIMQIKNCSVVAKDEEDELIAGIKLLFYYGTGPADYMAVPLSDASELMGHEKFNKCRCTQFFTFGYTRDVNFPNVREVILAYISNDTYNLIVMDWSSISLTTPYEVAVTVVQSAAPVVAKAVDSMIEDGLKLSGLTGHSLGAQFVGHIGRNMEHEVGWLTALDPAGPLFYNQPPLFLQCADPVAPGDAVVVQTIHTDRGVLGGIPSTGDLDYFMNNGSAPQPGCPKSSPDVIDEDLLCSHERVMDYWAEILRNSTAFLGRRCESYDTFLRGDCNNNSAQYIRQYSHNTILGNFYVQTNSKSPYGRGVDGSITL